MSSKANRKHRESYETKKRQEDNYYEPLGSMDVPVFERSKSVRSKFQSPLNESAPDSDTDLERSSSRPSAARKSRASSYDPFGDQMAEADARRLFDQYFGGSRKAKRVEKRLRETDFLVYYRAWDGKGEPPFRLPLYLAYKDSEGNCYHFPVINFMDSTSEREWKVKVPGAGRSASFASLSRLINFYTIYSHIDPETGAIEVFPVWQCKRSMCKE